MILPLLLQLNDFVGKFESTCFYGFCENSIKSLLLSIFSASSHDEDMDIEISESGDYTVTECLLYNIILQLHEKVSLFFVKILSICNTVP